MTAARPTLPVDDMLILARLLQSSKSRPNQEKVRTDVNRLLARPLDREPFADHLQELRDAGLVDPNAMTLTNSGCDIVMRWLQIATLPRRLDWRAIRYKYLLPKFVTTGRKIDPAAAVDKFSKQLLASNIPALPAKGSPLEVLLCQVLGHPELTTVQALLRRVLSTHLGVSQALTPDQLLRMFACQATGAAAPKKELLAEGYIRRKLAIVKPAIESSLLEFAQAVNDAASRCQVGRHGDDKVFVAAVYDNSQHQPILLNYNLATFKKQLAEAHQLGLVRLARADLTPAFDAELLQRSEVDRVGVILHFIIAPRADL